MAILIGTRAISVGTDTKSYLTMYESAMLSDIRAILNPDMEWLRCFLQYGVRFHHVSDRDEYRDVPNALHGYQTRKQ